MRAAKNTFARIAPTLLLVVGVVGVTLAVTGCGGSNTDAESAAVTRTQSEASVPIDDRAADGPILTPAPDGETRASFVFTDHMGAAVASLEERIYMAEVIVKARLVTTAEDLLTFRSLEYLKGTGPGSLTVRAETDGRDTRWDGQDAILFLDAFLGPEADFSFTDTTDIKSYFINPDCHACPKEYTGELPEGYTLGTRNPVWLPFESSGTTAGGRSPGTSNVVVETEVGRTGTISEKTLQKRINWIEGPTSSLRSTGYNFCIVSALGYYRSKRDHEAYFGQPREIPVFDENTVSGLARGTVVGEYGELDGAEYSEYLITGQDRHLFTPLRTDDDDLSTNGYRVDHAIARPLPAGRYTYHHQTHPYWLEPCNFQPPDSHMVFNVTVEAPEGTVHEAFFDPATTTAGVGYLATTSTTTGVLEPAAFSVRGRAITITGLTWQNGRVVLTLDRFGSWLDGFSFIETDGTVGLRLAEVDATKDWTARTLTWEVSERPWESGDELMMRMGPIPLPAVRNLTAEANSAGEVVLRWEVAYRAGVSGYRIWRHRPGRDEGPRIYVSDTLSTDTTYTDANSPVPNLAEYRVQAIDRVYNAGESSESVRVGSQ